MENDSLGGTAPPDTAIDWRGIDVLTFDCYGTLIDWETGIVTTLLPILAAHRVRIPTSDMLELYAECEGDAEREPFHNYKSVLILTMLGIERRLGLTFSEEERKALVESIKQWKPFPDTVAALKELKKRFKMAIISNTDDDIFSFTQPHLEVKFDWVVTAEQVRSYKPSLNNFQAAFARINVPLERIVHIAQSIYHDIVPAKQLGLRTVWVNRRYNQKGSGATLPAVAKADAVVRDLRSLVGAIEDSH